ncbi:hypothetical protein C7974DRAFT_455705 [Boeremia exigua]|uniref:uncharacterized protein n=1 Tax=Boeremia exigua TaxID=749465 RepID=UPI001E8E810B|nr:uncharacterized protein C7974DRAFT_455705 [Boeremia exigua]KAH6625522.1 hypothetical protein C7974DRAFT_455705 [Boeremia exigua]
MALRPRHFTEEEVASCNGKTDRKAGINDRVEELSVHASDHNQDSKVQSEDASDIDDTERDNDENSDTDSEDAYNSKHHSPPSPYQPHSLPPRPSAADLSTLRTHLNGLHTIPPRPPFRPQPTHPPPTTPFTVIGRGTAGTVFAIPGTEFALKKGSVRASIWADSQMTNIACNAVMECKSTLEYHFPGLSVPRVPRVHDWVVEGDLEEWWDANGARFVNTRTAPGIDDARRAYVFRTLRIPSLPPPAIAALIRAYFHPDAIPAALRAPANTPCLVRPYLGRRRSAREINEFHTSLENFPLYLDQLLDIDTNLAQCAAEMAFLKKQSTVYGARQQEDCSTVRQPH